MSKTSLRIELPEETKEQFRTVCQQKDRSMSQQIRAFIQGYLNQVEETNV